MHPPNPITAPKSPWSWVYRFFPLTQFRTSVQGHLRSRVPHGISWGLVIHLVTLHGSHLFKCWSWVYCMIYYLHEKLSEHKTVDTRNSHRKGTSLWLQASRPKTRCHKTAPWASLGTVWVGELLLCGAICFPFPLLCYSERYFFKSRKS